MINRNYLIALSLKYEGEYQRVIEAINAREEIENVQMDNCITIVDNDYPKVFFELKQPPIVLYYKGDKKLLENNNIIGVVGSRNACDYAISATKDLLTHYKDKIVVSGLAKGIDAIAHQTSEKSIGVLGCGIDYIYPGENTLLYKKLEKQGLIISEYPNKVLPLAFHFPIRNRIIAALSKELYIMQSSNKSGTMTTINEALELNRDIKVLPYSVYETSGNYNNNLINDGALMITNDELLIDK